MSFTETYTEDEQNTLIDLAVKSIQHGLDSGTPLNPNPDLYPENLRRRRATFVTLKIHNDLRGCIGTLEARRPLVNDVANNAYAAAFEDPRFPPLQATEFSNLDLHISILSEVEFIEFDSETDLIAKIRPNIDGLILEDGYNRGTFLPSVWESLPTPESFLTQLKRKAGLPMNYWSETLRVSRYTTFEFGQPVA